MAIPAYEFDRQWSALKRYANERNVFIIGDLPLYVAYDSVDVWLRPKLFKLNPDLSLKKIAGVPPDFFTDIGQLWGNPVYHWAEHKKRAMRGGSSVCARHLCSMTSFGSIISAGSTDITRSRRAASMPCTACGGQAPRASFFKRRKKRSEASHHCGRSGIQDAGVRRLVRETGYPRMKIMGFAFDGNARNEYLPKYIEENSVCYTGTHDNDTMLGMLLEMSAKRYRVFVDGVQKMLSYFGESDRPNSKKDVVKAVVKIAMLCPSRLTVIPIQDILVLDNRSRMNLPGTVGENWKFRLKTRLTSDDLSGFGELVSASQREC